MTWCEKKACPEYAELFAEYDIDINILGREKTYKPNHYRKQGQSMIEDRIFSQYLTFSPSEDINHAYMLFKKHSITSTENISGVELVSQWALREFFVMQEPIYEYWKSRKITYAVEILVD